MRVKINYLVIPSLVALVLWSGYLIVQPGMLWYEDLLLPPLTPPRWVFPIVWGILGLLTTYSLLLVWNRIPRDQIFWTAALLFGLNGLLNVGWTYAFFYRHALLWSFRVASSLALNLILLIVILMLRSRRAAFLLIPYVLWVLFACYLNYEIWFFNEAL